MNESKEQTPLHKELGGKDLSLYCNGVKMISGIEVGDFTFQTIYAENKIAVLNKGKTIKEYPIVKMKEAKAEFKELIKGKKIKKESEELPKVPTKSDFMLVAEPNRTLVIYDLRDKKPTEVMQLPPRQLNRAYKELMKLHCGRN